MKIHLMTGLLRGGAANGAKQLTRALRSCDVDATLHYNPRLKPSKSESRDSSFQPIRWQRRSIWKHFADSVSFRLERERFKRMARRRPPGFEIFSSPRGVSRTSWPPASFDFSGQDVLHLHWVSRLIDYPSFFPSIPSTMPIVWTLHDMNPLTGGCHFSAGCNRFRQGCGRCPQLPSYSSENLNHSDDADDFSASAFRLKANAMRGLNLHVVAPSRWLIDQAKASPIFQDVKSFHRIPYGLADESHQAIIGRQQARQELGIPEDTFVFCFGAADVSNQRKGARFLIPAMKHLSKHAGRDVLGLVFGGGELPPSEVPLQTLGYLNTAAERLRVFAASDVFVVPSTEDNLPITAMEAMAGGTAMLGFDVSGIPDLVIEGHTGRLAKLGDAQDLGAKLAEMESDRQATQQQGENARAMAANEFTAGHEANAYRTLYAALLSDSESAPTLPTAV